MCVITIEMEMNRELLLIIMAQLDSLELEVKLA